MKEHHKKSIDNLVRFLREDSNFLAIIIAGSIAKGIARDDSDIDTYLVVTDSEFNRRKTENNLFYFNGDVCDYPGGYIDGKIINYEFLESALRQGSEPTRASFMGAFVAFTRISGLESIIKQIPIYQEENRQKNLIDFYAQVLLYGRYFAIKAIEQNNHYLLSQSISNIVLFSGRMILAYNRILFPCHKSLMRVVEEAPEKPENYIKLTNNLLINPTKESISEFVDLISSYKDWGITFSQAVSIFINNNEWNWIDTTPPIQDR
ncbi:hypothetical protein [Paenibacillus sedimenti]|uniref:Nucleotidyltransferase domain-containing protein n=1 Tax=Paenibacillus sedimenti TaxID=2770274 RepID=A0A926QMP8_9BACL|nr:hypothetical protein [Paenibacillus sedimenti]MBD0384880.1 hypothetical protein [Paenibacillus sedimenti]